MRELKCYLLNKITDIGMAKFEIASFHVTYYPKSDAIKPFQCQLFE
ncbi:hypothetical protein ACJZL2_07540 [Wolbachia endosymbiont of Rhagoletis cingulata]